MEDILDFLPEGPNLGPFSVLGDTIAAIIALILAAILVYSIVMVFIGFMRWAFSGGNHAQASRGVEDMKRHGKAILIVLAFGLIVAFLSLVLGGIFGGAEDVVNNGSG